MYSVEDRFTFENLQEWIENAHDSIDDPENFVWALVGNKCDLPLEIEHDTILSRQEQLQTELSFFTSAKTGDNVTEAFERIIEAIHTRQQGDRSKAVATRASVIKISKSTRAGGGGSHRDSKVEGDTGKCAC